MVAYTMDLWIKMQRVKNITPDFKLWQSELSSHNKSASNNAFRVPVPIAAFEIPDVSEEEILSLDIKIWKILTSSRDFYRNNDIGVISS